MRFLLSFSLLVCFSATLLAQPTTAPAPKPKNLVQNFSFEVRADSTQKLELSNPAEKLSGWSSPNRGEPKVFTSIPKGDKFFVYDQYGANWDFAARSGRNVAGINVRGGTIEHPKREYLQGTLKEPLTVGKKYYFGFWVHYHCEGANNIGIAFLPNKAKLDSAGLLPFQPASFQQKVTNYDKKSTWTLVRDSFIAYKPYQYFVIGNFFPDSLTKVQSKQYNHYFAFIDDILVMEAENQNFSKPIDEKKEMQKWVGNTVTAQNTNKAIVLESVYFDYDKATLLPESFPSLNELAEQMKAVPTLKIKVKGHTSTEGDAPYNLKLSRNRAKSVRAYLIEKGVEESRISSEGYGETQPIGPNDTEEERARNRRVEFEILAK
jgi:outer membrane protein OmpA-like peptidoglycan-associated protein